MTISEKVAYLKGLSEGLGIDTEKSKEGKLIQVIIDVLEEVGLSIEDLEDTVGALDEEVEAISEDLAAVEDDLYEDEDEDCCCEDDEDFFEVECPNCGATLEIDADVLDAGVIECHGCGQKFALDLYDDCDCDCCGGHVEEAEVVEEPKKPAKKAAKKSEKKADKKGDK